MLEGLGAGLAELFITWLAPLIGCIPVLVGWRRFNSQPNSDGQRRFPKALWALTASICIDPVGTIVVGFINDRLATGALRYVQVVPGLWTAVLVIGFILNVIALVLAVSERNAARAAVLTGSIAVTVVNVAGFIWLFIGTDGSPLSY